jgi:hypothetical protein
LARSDVTLGIIEYHTIGTTGTPAAIKPNTTNPTETKVNPTDNLDGRASQNVRRPGFTLTSPRNLGLNFAILLLYQIIIP